jgi:hypothetical protein
VPRQAGLPPINTVVAQAPSSGDPCIVLSPSRAAGLGIVAVSLFQKLRIGRSDLDDTFNAEERISSDPDRVTWIDQLESIAT